MLNHIVHRPPVSSPSSLLYCLWYVNHTVILVGKVLQEDWQETYCTQLLIGSLEITIIWARRMHGSNHEFPHRYLWVLGVT